MIERLAAGLYALSVLPSEALESPEGQRLAGDCADAVRLALDCPQHDLSALQRDILRRLGDLLEGENMGEDALRAAVHATRSALGLDATRVGE